jgi:hypothetical protein
MFGEGENALESKSKCKVFSIALDKDSKISDLELKIATLVNENADGLS